MSRADYTLLGLERLATPNETDINSAYRKLALIYHPDKNPGSDTAASFIQIGEARDRLLKHIKEAAKDRSYKPDVKAQARSRSQPTPRHKTQQYERPKANPPQQSSGTKPTSTGPHEDAHSAPTSGPKQRKSSARVWHGGRKYDWNTGEFINPADEDPDLSEGERECRRQERGRRQEQERRNAQYEARLREEEALKEAELREEKDRKEAARQRVEAWWHQQKLQQQANYEADVAAFYQRQAAEEHLRQQQFFQRLHQEKERIANINLQEHLRQQACHQAWIDREQEALRLQQQDEIRRAAYEEQQRRLAEHREEQDRQQRVNAAEASRQRQRHLNHQTWEAEAATVERVHYWVTDQHNWDQARRALDPAETLRQQRAAGSWDCFGRAFGLDCDGDVRMGGY